MIKYKSSLIPYGNLLILSSSNINKKECITKDRMYAIASSCGHQKGGGEGVKWRQWCVKCHGHHGGDSTEQTKKQNVKRVLVPM